MYDFKSAGPGRSRSWHHTSHRTSRTILSQRRSIDVEDVFQRVFMRFFFLISLFRDFHRHSHVVVRVWLGTAITTSVQLNCCSSRPRPTTLNADHTLNTETRKESDRPVTPLLIRRRYCNLDWPKCSLEALTDPPITFLHLSNCPRQHTP